MHVEVGFCFSPAVHVKDEFGKQPRVITTGGQRETTNISMFAFASLTQRHHSPHGGHDGDHASAVLEKCDMLPAAPTPQTKAIVSQQGHEPGTKCLGILLRHRLETRSLRTMRASVSLARPAP